MTVSRCKKCNAALSADGSGCPICSENEARREFEALTPGEQWAREVKAERNSNTAAIPKPVVKHVTPKTSRKKIATISVLLLIVGTVAFAVIANISNMSDYPHGGSGDSVSPAVPTVASKVPTHHYERRCGSETEINPAYYPANSSNGYNNGGQSPTITVYKCKPYLVYDQEIAPPQE